MAVRIQLRRDTAANWTSVNPTLAEGEYGYETDTGKHKIGDGTTAWNLLEYNGIARSELEAKQDIIQYSTMPEITAATVGKIVQYIGATTSQYVNGWYYVAEFDDVTGQYMWVNKLVQEAGGTEVTGEKSGNNWVKITIDGVEGNIPTGGGGGGSVSSVNSQTPDVDGNVLLKAQHINATNNQSIQANLERIDTRIDELDTEQITYDTDNTLKDKLDSVDEVVAGKKDTFTEGQALEIDAGVMNVLVDGDTIDIDTDGNLKANAYKKDEVDSLLDYKADKSTTYTKTEVDTALGSKADKSTTYTKTEIDSGLNSKLSNPPSTHVTSFANRTALLNDIGSKGMTSRMDYITFSTQSENPDGSSNNRWIITTFYLNGGAFAIMIAYGRTGNNMYICSGGNGTTPFTGFNNWKRLVTE